MAVVELPTTYQGTVYPWQCDHMGHLNVMWYVGKFDEATWHLFALVGLTPSFLRQHDRGMAGVQQNISSKRELRAGDIVAIQSGILEMSEKVMRFFHETRNEETGEVCAVTVLIAVHMDTKARKSCPFPEEILGRGRRMIVRYEPAIWEPCCPDSTGVEIPKRTGHGQFARNPTAIRPSDPGRHR